MSGKGARNPNRQRWHEDEDESLRVLMSEYGGMETSRVPWVDVALRLGDSKGFGPRDGKQCRERWTQHLDPSIKKGEWSAEEERKFIEAHKRLGNQWATLAECELSHQRWICSVLDTASRGVRNRFAGAHGQRGQEPLELCAASAPGAEGGQGQVRGR